MAGNDLKRSTISAFCALAPRVRHNLLFHCNRVSYDYSEYGTFRSIDDSLKRLRVDRLDFVWINDVAQDFHGDKWLAQFETARKGAFGPLTRLREAECHKSLGPGSKPG
jgi:aryl-alcohol dehydrogenase-like predicted oxidoreductase